MPYPVGLHFESPSRPPTLIDFASKDLLVFTTWESKTEDRKRLMAECLESNVCVHFENHYDEYNATLSQQMSESAIFCPQPAGDSPSR